MKNNTSLSDQVFEKVQDKILDGELERGSVITEKQVADELGISRTPVREAFKMLEREHLIEDKGKGMLILGISDKDMEEAYYIREKLEGHVGKQAAKNISDEDIKKLQELLDLQEFYVERGNPNKISEIDTQFHQIVYAASDSTIMKDVLMTAHLKIHKYRNDSVTKSDQAVISYAEHAEIFEALKAHDQKAAAKAMEQHAKNAHERIRGTL